MYGVREDQSKQVPPACVLMRAPGHPRATDTPVFLGMHGSGDPVREDLMSR